METRKNNIHTVYIGNMSYNRDEDGVLGLFKKFGYIKNINIMRTGKDNKSKGVAFVDMVNLGDAKKAINALDGTQVDGRTLKVSLAKTQNFKEKSLEKKEEKISQKEEAGLKKRAKKLNKKEGLQALFNR